MSSLKRERITQVTFYCSETNTTFFAVKKLKNEKNPTKEKDEIIKGRKLTKKKKRSEMGFP